jgi:hypothetical protein
MNISHPVYLKVIHLIQKNEGKQKMKSIIIIQKNYNFTGFFIDISIQSGILIFC